MEIPRKLGVGILMVVPTFVGSGALWEIFNSWWAVLVWVIIMAFLYGGFYTGRLPRP